MLKQVRNYVLPAMQKKWPVTAWIVDETSYVKKGIHSVGVARQYCGRLGKKENCQVAVIHPGKPRNPSEPGLEALLKRAEVFL